MNSEILIKKTKKIKKEKKRQKQKQKQKQNVKQSVEVKVQSSGGSSAGGGGGYVPSAFQDRTGENVRLQNILDVLQKSAKASAPVSAPAPVPASAPKSSSAPPNPFEPAIKSSQPYSYSKPSSKSSYKPSLTSYDPFSMFDLPSDLYVNASDFSSSGNIDLTSKPNIDNKSLLDRISINENIAEEEMNNINRLEKQRRNYISNNNLEDAVRVGEEIDDADDLLNVLNNDIQNEVESRAEATPKRKYRTKEQIAIDEANKPPKNKVGRPPKSSKDI